MRRTVGARLWLVAVAIGGVLLNPRLAFPQQTEAADERWRVGVAEFSGDGLSRENGYLLSSLPLQLLDRLEGIDTHHLSPEAQEERRQAILRRRRAEAERQLARLYAQQDRRFLDARGSDDRTETQIAEAKAELAALEGLEPSDIPVPVSEPTRFVEGEDGRLVQVVTTIPSEVTERHGLDMLVYGHIEQVSEYVFVDVKVFSSDSGQSKVFTTGGSREAIRSRMAEIGAEVLSEIYGAPWGSLVIEATNDRSRIGLDDRYLGTGTRTLEPVSVGPHRVRVETPGFETQEYEVIVEAGAEASVRAAPGERIDGDVVVETVPSGASVYVGSAWEGNTPTTVTPPLESAQVLLELPGYGEHQGIIESGNPEGLSVELVPSLLEDAGAADSRRRVFYRSLGMFAVSVPVPLFMLDVTNQLTAIVNTETPGSPQIKELLVQRQMAFSGYVAGMFVAGALFVNVVIDLLEYVNLIGLRTG